MTEEFIFKDHQEDVTFLNDNTPWNILIVDDEQDVHDATIFALRNSVMLNKPLKFYHAFTAAEATEKLSSIKDVAVILLDVVMETEQAGLDLIKVIRKELVLTGVRIILRTGQPGYAPEISTIEDYDINDYKTKGELTKIKLFTSVLTGVKAYKQFQELEALAYYDGLSKLPNRNKFLAILQEIQDTIANLAVCLLDIDDFAEINNSLGHQQGDRLLQAVVQRLADNLPANAVIARLDSNTFGVLGIHSQLNPDILLEQFITPFVVNGDSIQISVSIGALRLKQFVCTPDEALKFADIALKQAKRSKRGGYINYSVRMGDEIRERMALLQNLRLAVTADDRLFVAYQPQVDLATGKFIGVEALMRWKDNDGQYIQPDKFIPLAETSGLIIALGEWILRVACFEQVRLAHEGHVIRMSVNVSQLQFRHPEFLKCLKRAIDDSGINPLNLELEITESVAMEDTDFILNTFYAIKGLKISIAIDDFGTGYSSLNKLRLLPIDRLKIDRAFVTELDTPAKAYIAETVIKLAHNFDLHVIAEGIETPGQEKMLKDMGCHEGQGYLYSKPLAIEQLKEWIDARA